MGGSGGFGGNGSGGGIGLGVGGVGLGTGMGVFNIRQNIFNPIFQSRSDKQRKLRGMIAIYY